MRTNVHDTSDQRGCHFSHIGHTGSVYGDQDAGGVNPDGEDEKEEQEDEEQEEAEEEQEEEKEEEAEHKESEDVADAAEEAEEEVEEEADTEKEKPDDDDIPSGQPSPKRKKISGKSKDIPFIGWCNDLMNAYKCDPTTGANKVWAKQIDCSTSSIFPTATFEDNTKHEVTAISCEELQTVRLAGKRLAPNCVWTGVHQGCTVKVSVKKDHTLLVVMHRFEPKQKMICMVSVSAFGNEGEDYLHTRPPINHQLLLNIVGFP
jgi:hypothetical protein